MQPRQLAYFEFEPNAVGRGVSYLFSAGPRRCRFCQRDATQARFTKDAHAIPEALGNHKLLSREECDDCNKLGSSFEDDLAKHLSVSRAMSRLRAKEGDVKHRFGKNPSSIESDSKNNRVIVHRTIGDTSLQTRRTPSGIQYVVKVPGHRPMNVVKALARIGFMLAPEKVLAELDHVRRWLRGELPWASPSYDQAFIPGPGMTLVRVLLDKHETPGPGEPHFSLSVAYGCDVLVLHIPGPDFSQARLPAHAPIRSPYPPYVVKVERLTVTRDDVLRGRVDVVDVAVPALAALPRLSHDEIAVAAYYRWLRRGAPLSSPEETVDDWLEAEQDLLWAQVDPQVNSHVAQK